MKILILAIIPFLFGCNPTITMGDACDRLAEEYCGSGCIGLNTREEKQCTVEVGAKCCELSNCSNNVPRPQVFEYCMKKLHEQNCSARNAGDSPPECVGALR